ncbi:hypothetical protein [Paenibacillus sp. NPDC057967]
MEKWILLLTIFAGGSILPAYDSAPAEPFRRIVQRMTRATAWLGSIKALF